MKFGKLHLQWFGAEDGAGSIVTETEASDPAITLDRFEKEVVAPIYPDQTIHRGPRSKNEAAALKKFYDHFTGEELTIPFLFAKHAGNELRLYNTGQSRFTPRAGDVWFIYRKDGKLYVGSMPEAEWRNLGTDDPDDTRYQNAIQSGIPDTIITTVPDKSLRMVSSFKRNPVVSCRALENAGFRCEYDPETALFVSRSTSRYYVEAHHLIPLQHTELIGANLDVVENIVALSPHWHRAIHHACCPIVRDVVNKLYEQRAGFLRGLGLSESDLIELYGCEPID